MCMRMRIRAKWLDTEAARDVSMVFPCLVASYHNVQAEQFDTMGICFYTSTVADRGCSGWCSWRERSCNCQITRMHSSALRCVRSHSRTIWTMGNFTVEEALGGCLTVCGVYTRSRDHF